MSTENNVEVNVKNGRYVGKKWFIKLAYKMIETDVEFLSDKLSLSQGSGFVKAKNKVTTEIKYENIKSVTAKRKISIPNALLAVAAVVAAFASGEYAVLLAAAIVLFIGTTAVAAIEHSEGVYEVPTEFKAEAEELQEKINAAINAAK